MSFVGGALSESRENGRIALNRDAWTAKYFCAGATNLTGGRANDLQ